MEAAVLDATNSVVLEPTREGFPPLMIVAEDLDAAEIDQMRDVYEAALENRRPLVIGGDHYKVFQLIDGRWQRLD